MCLCFTWCNLRAVLCFCRVIPCLWLAAFASAGLFGLGLVSFRFASFRVAGLAFVCLVWPCRSHASHWPIATKPSYQHLFSALQFWGALDVSGNEGAEQKLATRFVLAARWVWCSMPSACLPPCRIPSDHRRRCPLCQQLSGS